MMGILARLAVCSLLVLVLSAQAWGQEPVPADCLRCICKVESNCEMPDPLCKMDVGSLACGPYQMHSDYYDDAGERSGLHLMGSWKTCAASFECSEQAVQAYMARYAVHRRLGHDPTCEDFARIHNGGPDGYMKSKTVKYWNLVQECLQCLD